MSVIDKVFRWAGYQRIRDVGSFKGAAVSRLTNDWLKATRSINYDLRNDLDKLKARSRVAIRDTDLGAAFLEICQQNVVGERGFTFQSKVSEVNSKREVKPDKVANDRIETGWRKFCKLGQCTVTRQDTMQDLDDQIVASLCYDGEAFVRRVRNFDNKNKLAYQFLDSTLIDFSRNQEASKGKNVIRLGVEFNPWGEPVAYWFKKYATTYAGEIISVDYERLPAEQIIHIFPRVFPGQARGVPFFAPVLYKQHMLKSYEEAEIIAARAAAAKLGFITSATGTEFKGEKTKTGERMLDFEEGSFNQLAEGEAIQPYDPQHPNTAFSEFVRGCKQGIAAGLKVSYHSLTGDLTQVNYSSIRAGLLQERTRWMRFQGFIIDHWKTPSFEEWLEISLMLGSAGPLGGLPFSKFEKFNAPKWSGKRWPWVDPLKDAQAVDLQLKNGTLSRTEVAAEKGDDLEEHLDQLAEEKRMLEEKGLEFDSEKAAADAQKLIDKQDAEEAEEAKTAKEKENASTT